MRKAAFAALLAAFAVPAIAAGPPEPAKPLFAASDPLRLIIRGPVSAFARGNVAAGEQREATLGLAGGETLAITLAPRGITRLTREVCQFPPLRVEFRQAPPATSPFAAQRKLKLVTHCRAAQSFQQKVLLEYTAYRLYNVMTPASLRVRLALIDYVDDDGRPLISRMGYFIEDPDDAARRLGLREVLAGPRVPTASLSPRDGARYALFRYMIADLDWSMRGGPAGDSCCHNSKLAGDGGSLAGPLVPIPYDFDYSGLVSAPYALPPEGIRVPNVRTRQYRGHCVHNGHVPAAAAEFRARHGELLGVLAQVPGLEPATQRKAADFLNRFFADIADDASIADKLLRTCIN